MNIYPVKSRFIVISIVFITLIMMTNCSKSPDIPGPGEVYIKDLAFNPSTIFVSANTTVTWTNKDGVSHTVTSNSGVFDSGTILQGKTYSFQFTNPGSYPYHCTIHPSMTGTVVVN